MSAKKRLDLKGNGNSGNDGSGRKKAPAPPSETAFSGESSEKYGKEGTNKTIAQPKADNAPSEELGNTPHVGKSPYTRG
ncbi:hypothetical protein [Polaromonas sp. YR568]|uniref:hypothetical protein n=1 Tax=Polaromonas sp. YR568 TaxID=1855301 RepID=UPI0011143AC3|nr:hypothetical protein [Polaromonas sp. YR568]